MRYLGFRHFANNARTAYLGGSPATLTRRAAGSRNQHGEWSFGAADAPKTIAVLSEPLPPAEMRVVSIGGVERNIDRVFRSGERLQPADGFADGVLRSTGDLITWPATGPDAQTWRVMAVQAWDAGWGDNSRVWQADTIRAIPQAEATQSPGANAFERLIRTHVSQGSGISPTAVIPGYDLGPRPPTLYASVTLQSDHQTGHRANVFRLDGQDARADGSLQHQAMFSISFERSGAQRAADNFLRWIETPEARRAERLGGFALVLPFERHNTTVEYAGVNEDRADITLAVDHVVDYHRPETGIDGYTLEFCLGLETGSVMVTRGD